MTRDEKVENLVLNYPMIQMSLLEGAFANLASKMGEALVQGSSAMAEALAEGMSGTADNVETQKAKVKKPDVKIGPQISSEVKKMFADMRHQWAGFSMNDESFRKFIEDPAFDEGVKIVEKYDFGLPRLTERLTDDGLASYLNLLGKEDPEFSKMFRELSVWQEKAPKLQR